MFALIHAHMYKSNILVGIFTTIEQARRAMFDYELLAHNDLDSRDLHILNVDCDTDLCTHGYCVFSHNEMFGQVAHNIEYIARDPMSAKNQAIRLHSEERDMESEWLYEPVAIGEIRERNGESCYIDEIEYSWKNE